jgi:hypothetical protein
MYQMIRWVLILPAAIAAWFVAYLIGVALTVIIGLSLHSPTGVEQLVVLALAALGAALAAALVMITCVLLAPTHKRQVAIATFVVGTMVAIYMGLGIQFYEGMAAAIIAGGIVLALLLRRLPPLSLPNTSLERPRER